MDRALTPPATLQDVQASFPQPDTLKETPRVPFWGLVGRLESSSGIAHGSQACLAVGGIYMLWSQALGQRWVLQRIMVPRQGARGSGSVALITHHSYSIPGQGTISQCHC